MEKKKILIIGPAYPYRGGNSLFVAQTYEILKNDFDVKIFNYKLLYPSLLFPGSTQFDKSERIVYKPPSERIINSINPFNWFAVAKRIKKENADLVVFDWWHPFFGPSLGTIASLIKRKYKNRILFITENVVSHEANKIDKFLTLYGLKSASMFLALSRQVEKELHKYAKGRKIYRSVLPSYDCYTTEETIDKNRLRDKLNIKRDATVLLFFGYVRKYKGLDVLLEAMPAIIKSHPDTYLIVVGEFYDKPENYTSIVENKKLGSNVKILNRFVPNEEVAKYYQVADVVVLPYKSATQSAVLNVAFSFKKPVIVTNVEGLAEFVENGRTGVIVGPGSADEIVKGYEDFLKLKQSVDFVTNIEKRNKQNTFENLPELIKEMLDETQSK